MCQHCLCPSISAGRGVPARMRSTGRICHHHRLHARVPSVPARARGGSARRPPTALGAQPAAEHPSEGLGPWPSHGHGEHLPAQPEAIARHRRPWRGGSQRIPTAGSTLPAPPAKPCPHHALLLEIAACPACSHCLLPSPLRGQPSSWVGWAGWHAPPHHQLAQSGNLCSESMSK